MQRFSFIQLILQLDIVRLSETYVEATISAQKMISSVWISSVNVKNFIGKERFQTLVSTKK